MNLPSPLHSRPAVLLHCGPARTESPAFGEPVALIQLASGDEIDAPLFLRLADVRRTIPQLLEALTDSGHDGARHLLRHLNDSGMLVARRGGGMEIRTPLPAAVPPRMPAAVTATVSRVSIPLALVCDDGTRLEIKVVGGYRRGRVSYLLYEWVGRRTGHRGILQIVGRKRLCKLKPDRLEFLPYQHWAAFDAIDGGKTFEIGQKICKKMTVAMLACKTRQATYFATW